MGRYVVMGYDECGTEFNAGNRYFGSQEEAYEAMPKIREQYEEARILWVEPLFSDQVSVPLYGDDDYDHPSWEEEY